MDKELTERIDANYRAIAALTDQVAQLVRERDELQKQVWLYEKNGVTCQTYRHTVKQSCSECNVQMDYNTTPSQRKWVGLTDEEYKNIRYGSDESGERYVSYTSYDEGGYEPEIEIYVDDFARAIEAKLREKNT